VERYKNLKEDHWKHHQDSSISDFSVNPVPRPQNNIKTTTTTTNKNNNEKNSKNRETKENWQYDLLLKINIFHILNPKGLNTKAR